MRLIRNIAITFLAITALWWILRKLDVLPSLEKLFAPKETVIDQTPLVIREIKPLAQLVTITSYTEVVADSTVPSSTGERLRNVLNPFSLRVPMNRRLVVVGKVVIHAGVDMAKVRPQDVFVSRDSISIQLPPAEILDVIINPSGTEIFLEEGAWDNNAVVRLKTKLQNKAVQEALQRGVLYQADEKAREVLVNFFRAAGYRKVTVGKGRLG